MFKRPSLPAFLPALLLGLGFAAPAAAESDPYAICAANVARAEAGVGIPKGLLGAIAEVESGRWDKEKRAAIAWPWTVTSGANGQFFASKAEAIAEVRRMKAQGIRNIDVGCMQINLHHHAEAFDSLDEAFDPATNTAYAARFLRSLFDSHQDWMTAASHYHSATPELGARYRAKVLTAWNNDAGVSVRPANYELVQGPDWTLARPAAAQAQPVKLTSTTTTPSARPLPTVQKAAPQPVPAPTETAREEAKAFATAWREARLAEYKSRRAARGGV